MNPSLQRRIEKLGFVPGSRNATEWAVSQLELIHRLLTSEKYVILNLADLNHHSIELKEILKREEK